MTRDTAASASMDAGIAHGGRLIEAPRAFAGAPEPFIDLSTGINPHPYPLAAFDASLCARLPEPEALLALQAAAAQAYGAADPALVVAAPGTQILISLLPHLLGLKRAVVLGPTYGEHHAAWENAGAAVTTQRNPARFLQVAGATACAAILCNPNNPDGRRFERSTLLDLATGIARNGGVLICDEAFADLEAPDPGLAADLPHPGLLILRSFGKSYGLAGLRLGFLLASAPIAARIRRTLGPWAVSGPALAAGTLALADPAWREAMRGQLQQGCERLDAMLGAAGLGCLGGTRLFRLYRTGQAAALFTTLGQAGILVRRFADDPGLLRFGLPGEEAHWSRLHAALGLHIRDRQLLP